MAGRTVVKPLTKVNAAEYKQIYSLNHRTEGSMQSQLTVCKNSMPDKTNIVMVKEKGRVLAWAMVFPYAGYNGSQTAYFYTRRNLRGRGLGDRLMRGVHKVEPRPYVWPHDIPSGEFFKKYQPKVRIAAGSYWLRDR